MKQDARCQVQGSQAAVRGARVVGATYSAILLSQLASAMISDLQQCKKPFNLHTGGVNACNRHTGQAAATRWARHQASSSVPCSMYQSLYYIRSTWSRYMSAWHAGCFQGEEGPGKQWCRWHASRSTRKHLLSCPQTHEMIREDMSGSTTCAGSVASCPPEVANVNTAAAADAASASASATASHTPSSFSSAKGMHM